MCLVVFLFVSLLAAPFGIPLGFGCMCSPAQEISLHCLDFCLFVRLPFLSLWDPDDSYVVPLEFIPELSYHLFIYFEFFVFHPLFLSGGFLRCILQLTDFVLSYFYSATEIFHCVFHFTYQIL